MSTLKSKTVAPDDLHPNPWNPNQMNERTFDAERESIGRFGFIDPITVRQHPDIEGAYQIIDGEHRWRAAKDIGLSKVPVSVIEVTDTEAKKLTIVLNETRGEASTVELAALLAEIGLDDDNLLEALPYTDAQLQNLLALADLEVPEYDDAPEGGSEDDDEWVSVKMRIPRDAMPIWEQAQDILRSGGLSHGKPDVEAGLMLEAIAAEFIAGHARAKAE